MPKPGMLINRQKLLRWQRFTAIGREAVKRLDRETYIMYTLSKERNYKLMVVTSLSLNRFFKTILLLEEI